MEMKHFSLYLPDEVYEALRTRAFEERQSMSQIVLRALTGSAPPLRSGAPARSKTPQPRKKGGR